MQVIVHLNFPSKLTQAVDLLSLGTLALSTEESGNTTGRNDNVCAQMGVMSIAGTDGCTMDPPAASEYAVDPVQC